MSAGDGSGPPRDSVRQAASSAPSVGTGDGPTREEIWAAARSSTDREHRNVKIRPARSFGGLSGLRVFGLASLLVTVAILGVLAARVLAGTGDAASGLDVMAVTGQSRCELERDAVEQAVARHEAMTGILPHHEDVLVNLGMLSKPVETFTVRLQDGSVVITGVGRCRGE